MYLDTIQNRDGIRGNKFKRRNINAMTSHHFSDLSSILVMFPGKLCWWRRIQTNKKYTLEIVRYSHVVGSIVALIGIDGSTAVKKSLL